MTTTGSCLCGKVRFELERPIDDVTACHCVMCRRWAGGPFMAVHLSGGIVIEGEAHLAWYDSSPWAERGFCKVCGSNLFYRIKGDSPEYIISAGAIDDQAALNLKGQIFIDEKPGWYEFAGDVPSMTGAEVFAKYAPPSGEKP